MSKDWMQQNEHSLLGLITAMAIGGCVMVLALYAAFLIVGRLPRLC